MPWKDFDVNLFWRPHLWKQASRTLGFSEATLFPTRSWSSVAGPSHSCTNEHAEENIEFSQKFSNEDTNAALIPGSLLLLSQTARLRLECYGTFSGEPESPTEFSLWNEDEKWTGIVQLSKYDAEPVMQMCKGGNKAFFDFAAISITYIWDGPSPLHRFFDNMYESGRVFASSAFYPRR
ncbi:hypothetical protein EAF00_011995 [Botryotinia globosa]|nr:hypothetical protein EAF00_011995 [Botryotinia globosa]